MSTENLRAFITAQINTAFPGVYNIPLADASRFAGFAYQTARNKLQDGSFPLATIKIGKRVFISVATMVDYLVGQAPLQAATREFFIEKYFEWNKTPAEAGENSPWAVQVHFSLGKVSCPLVKAAVVESISGADRGCVKTSRLCTPNLGVVR